MARTRLQITSADGGLSPTYFGQPVDGYIVGKGIDPDVQSTGIKMTSGIIKPTAYTKFSGTEITGNPLWIETQALTENVYVYADDGKLHSFDNTNTMRSTDEASTSFPIAIGGGAGQGMKFFNNYLYIAEGDDLTRYGPFDSDHISAIAEDNDWWSGVGLKKFQNKTYPTILQAALPNHVMHHHAADGALYILDVLSDDRGTVHRVQTAAGLDYDGQSGNFTVGLIVTGGTSGATGVVLADNDGGATGTLTLGSVTGVFQNNEALTDTGSGAATVNGTLTPGQQDNGSAFNVLDLPPNYWPTCIESWGTDLVIGAIQSSGASGQLVSQGTSVLFFWDTLDDTFYHMEPVEDPYISALKYTSGELFAFSGNARAGCRVSQYNGNDLDEIMFIDDTVTPFQGAVTALGGRVAFGGRSTFPSNNAVVYSFGAKDKRRPSVARMPAVATSTGSTPIVSALKYVEQESAPNMRTIIGWGDATAKGLDEYSSTATHNSQYEYVFEIGEPFIIEELQIPLEGAVASGLSITVNITTDDFSGVSHILASINNTDRSGQEVIVWKRPEINIKGNDRFTLKLQWTGTKNTGVKFPITVIVDTLNNRTTV